MLAYLVRFSIRFYGVVIALAILILMYGSYRFNQAGLDIFPEFSPKQISIQTEAPGFSAEQVEILVTQPIEKVLSGLMGLETMGSESIQGLSIVTAIFDEHSDIYRNRQLVSEKLSSLAGQLPSNVQKPIPVPLSSSSATVLTIGLNSEIQDLMQLRDLVDRVIVPRLLAVKGVADVNIFGGGIRQIQIQLDPLKLVQFGMSISDLIKQLDSVDNHQGGGFVENSNQRFTLQITGKATTPEELAKKVVRYQSDKSIVLGDLADIIYAPEPAIGAAQIMGKRGIVMMVIGQFGANTLTVSNAIEQILEEFSTLFRQEDIHFYAHLFKPADYISQSIANLSSHLLLGGFFVIIILYVFLYNLRTALISAVTIPVSLIGSVLVLISLDIQLNIMVLGGLAIALGEVVDDAIIDTENIFRRLRENKQSVLPLANDKVVYEASMEVRSSVVYASFIVALVFVPLLTLEGMSGRLFAPLGYSYILAILMSLLVALTLTPALCYVFLSNTESLEKQPPVIAFLNPAYKKLLEYSARSFKTVVFICLLIMLMVLSRFLTLGHQFLPELREGHYMVHITSITGTSLDESIRQGIQITEQLKKLREIESVSQWAGRAERGADTYGSHYSEFEVRLKALSGKEQQQVLDKIRQQLAQFSGLLYEVNTFLTERIDETISGYTAPVVVNIYGDDFSVLDTKAREVAAVMHDISGSSDIQLRSPPSTPMLNIQLNQEKIAMLGVSETALIQTIQASTEGYYLGQYLQNNWPLNIMLTLAPRYRQQTELLLGLPISYRAGEVIKLGDVADIIHQEGRYNILHQNGQRKQAVTCHVVGRDMDSFMRVLKQRLHEDVEFPAPLYLEFTGAAIEQATAKKELLLHSLLASIGVLIFIYIAIHNIRHVGITLLNIPFSLLGGMMSVVLMDLSLSVGSVIGFITLFGITVRNSIMLLSHYQYLITIEKCLWNKETAWKGAQERLPSILMTALVTALAMAPIAFNSDNAGLEIMGPMAAIIIGGLISSTVLNLLLLPIMLLKYGRFG